MNQPSPPDNILDLRIEALEAIQAKDYTKAAALYERILPHDPDAVDVLNNLGQSLGGLGRHTEAIVHFKHALDVKPDEAFTNYNLAVAYHLLAEQSLADVYCLRALELQPDFQEAKLLKATIARMHGDVNDAILQFRNLLREYPDNLEAWNNLGIALSDQNRNVESANAFLEALKLDDKRAEVHANLSLCLSKLGRLDGAEASLKRALALKEEYSGAHNNLGVIYSSQARHEEAVYHFRRSLQIDPFFFEAFSNLLFGELHKDGTTIQDVYQLHDEWYHMFAAKHVPTHPDFSNVPDPNRKLKIGFVSGDFRGHPVGWFTIRTIEDLAKRDDFEVHLYAMQFDNDPLTARFMSACPGRWHKIWSTGDRDVVQMIKVEGIDILIDLTGHNDRNRLGVFALKPAPVQITWAGYMATTGLRTIDWLIGDRWQTPIAHQPYYCERIYQMPDAFICFTPPFESPPINAAPGETNSYITFGCFNKPAKISLRCIRLWTQILNELKNAKLILKFIGFGDTDTSRLFRQQFIAAGLKNPDQLYFEAQAQHRELMAKYNQVDIALDPMPYTGSTTTLEALWMGVPVITLPGEIFPARHSMTYLKAIGLDELIAQDEADYVHKVIALANDRPRVAEYRRTLRQKMWESPLCDRKRFEENFVQALRFMWKDWCDKYTAIK